MEVEILSDGGGEYRFRGPHFKVKDTFVDVNASASCVWSVEETVGHPVAFELHED